MAYYFAQSIKMADLGFNSLSIGVGRVGSFSTPFRSYDSMMAHASPATHFQNEALRGIQEESPISRAFFSAENLSIIQNRIRFEIYTKSKNTLVINPQNPQDLQVVMRGIYLSNISKLKGSAKEIISGLNDLVSIEAVKNIWTNLQQHIAYMADASTLPTPMARPVNMSSAGTKSLPFVSFF